MPAPGVDLTLDDGVLTLRLVRPEARNALTAEMVAEITRALEDAHADDGVRTVLVTGSGGSFSAGADIGGADPQERLGVDAVAAANRLVRAVVRCDKPVVAGVNGVAAGVGASLALAADLHVCVPSASFLLAFAKIGLMPDGGVVATMAAAIGRARTMRMALLAEPLSAEDAYAAGLVSHLVPEAELDAELTRLTAALAAGAPLAQAASKRAVNAAALGGLDDALENELTTQPMLLRTADVAEGMQAFAARRPPTFRGR